MDQHDREDLQPLPEIEERQERPARQGPVELDPALFSMVSGGTDYPYRGW